MKSYTTGRNLYGTWTKNSVAANLTLGDQMANDDYRLLCTLRDWPFLEKYRPLTTIASTQAYNLPYDTDLVREINVVVSNITYTPKLSPSRQHWDELNLSIQTSDIPEWYFIFAGQLQLWPKPASSSNTINLTTKARVIDLSIADYTTGTITTTSTTAGVTTVTGSGTAWTAQMVGRYIQITLSNTANTGDGLWYEIASVPSATTMTLVRAYGGTALTAASANYTIGQMPLLPEAFHDMPWQYAAGMYWLTNEDKRAQGYLSAHGNLPGPNTPASGRVKALIDTYTNPTTNMVIDDGQDFSIINPNLTVRL